MEQLWADSNMKLFYWGLKLYWANKQPGKPPVARINTPHKFKLYVWKGVGDRETKDGKQERGVVLVTLDLCVHLYLWYVKCGKFLTKASASQRYAYQQIHPLWYLYTLVMVKSALERHRNQGIPEGVTKKCPSWLFTITTINSKWLWCATFLCSLTQFW